MNEKDWFLLDFYSVNLDAIKHTTNPNNAEKSINIICDLLTLLDIKVDSTVYCRASEDLKKSGILIPPDTIKFQTPKDNI